MPRTTAFWGQVLMSVSWFSIQICVDRIPLKNSHGIKKCHFIGGTLCSKFDGWVKKDTMEYLVPRNPRTARFYHQPKIHKPTVPVPGRPIVSSCGTPTERISEYVDYHLQPFVTQTRSHLKDMTNFLLDFPAFKRYGVKNKRKSQLLISTG